MKHLRNHLAIVFICVLPLIICSCFGLSMDIVLNKNGAGTIALEYLVSRSAASLGELDGNERWNTIPTGRADFERTLARLPEIKLLSFSSNGNERDIVVNAKMEFESLNGLMSFLDAGGLRSSYAGDANSGRILLVLGEQRAKKPPSFEKLIEDISKSYFVKMSMSFPDKGTLGITNSSGLSANEKPGHEIVSSGKKVSFSFPLYTFLSSDDGIKAEFQW